MPFLVLLFAAAARLFAHRRTAAKLAEAYEGLPEGAADADEAEAHARIFFETREGGRERGDRSGERFDDSRRTSLATLACALVAGASAPSLLALPYVVFCAFCALAHGLETHGALTPLQTRRRRNEAARRRAGGGGGGSGASGNSLGERSRPLAGFSFLRRGGNALACAAYAASHFALVYAYQLPELAASADGAKAEWLGLYVYASDAPGGGAGGDASRAKMKIAAALESAQLAALAGLFCCLCATEAEKEAGGESARAGGGGARRGGGVRRGGVDGSARHDDASVDASDGATRLSAPLLDGYASSDDDVDGARLEARSGANSACDDPVTGAHGSDRSGASTPRGPPTFEAPPLATRLFARFAGALAAVVVVFASLAFPSVAAAPALAFALRAITSRPDHGGFARRRGPPLLAYVAAWALAEYAAASLPEAVLRKVVVGGGGGGGGVPAGDFFLFRRSRRRFYSARARLQVPGPPPGLRLWKTRRRRTASSRRSRRSRWRRARLGGARRRTSSRRRSSPRPGRGSPATSRASTRRGGVFLFRPGPGRAAGPIPPAATGTPRSWRRSSRRTRRKKTRLCSGGRRRRRSSSGRGVRARATRATGSNAGPRRGRRRGRRRGTRRRRRRLRRRSRRLASPRARRPPAPPRTRAPSPRASPPGVCPRGAGSVPRSPR